MIMKFSKQAVLLFLIAIILSCQSADKKTVPVVGFVDAFEDATIAQAKQGFTDALKEAGFSEEKNTISILYRNAQGDIPTLTQIVNYFATQKVDLFATSTTLSTITAIQKNKRIPIFAMVSPTPQLMNVVDTKGNIPANLFGAVEDMNYIDTSFSIIPQVVHAKNGRLKVGMIFNQAEPQSADAMRRIKQLAGELQVTLIALPVNTSADAQLVTQSLLSQNIDAFFANPDNTVFASFETIKKNCELKKVPIFTSEAGLVKRGAVAAFGADIYQWGHQAGEQAAQYLKTGNVKGLKPELVKIRKRVYNPAMAKKFNITLPANFEPLN